MQMGEGDEEGRWAREQGCGMRKQIPGKSVEYTRADPTQTTQTNVSVGLNYKSFVDVVGIGFVHLLTRLPPKGFPRYLSLLIPGQLR